MNIIIPIYHASNCASAIFFYGFHDCGFAYKIAAMPSLYRQAKIAYRQ